MPGFHGSAQVDSGHPTRSAVPAGDLRTSLSLGSVRLSCGGATVQVREAGVCQSERGTVVACLPKVLASSARLPQSTTTRPVLGERTWEMCRIEVEKND